LALVNKNTFLEDYVDMIANLKCIYFDPKVRTHQGDKNAK
jgi:hypothetical protein